MMRQYELVERVTRYDPDANEDLLNRAYVYAMKAHGNQKRASGEAYFNHPLEVAAILTEMKLDAPPLPRRCFMTRWRIPRPPSRRSRRNSVPRSPRWSMA